MSHTDQGRSIAQRHNDYVWPLVILAVAVLAALVVIIVTNHKPDDLLKALTALLAALGSTLGGLSYLKSSQAAKQTNGDLDDRMTTAVQQGITLALKQAQQQQTAPPAAASGRRPRAARPASPIVAPIDPHAPDGGNHPDQGVTTA